MPKKIAVYVRVSTKAQDKRSQEPDLKRWVANQDDEVLWFRDAFTGRTMNRPGMEKLIAGVRAGTIRTIVCWRLDRLGRTARGLTALFEELRERNVGRQPQRWPRPLHTRRQAHGERSRQRGGI
jgi:DNA invertase Pin-like site-specific DNA recombinase